MFPELNHNEMTGFDSNSATQNLMEKFHFIFCKIKLMGKNFKKNRRYKKYFGTTKF